MILYKYVSRVHEVHETCRDAKMEIDNFEQRGEVDGIGEAIYYSGSFRNYPLNPSLGCESKISKTNNTQSTDQPSGVFTT